MAKEKELAKKILLSEQLENLLTALGEQNETGWKNAAMQNLQLALLSVKHHEKETENI